jgi:3-methyl-2-oxobutanoate hydroxymethyltransferase
MSAQNRVTRRTVSDIRMQKGGTPIVCLTAYTAPVAQWADEVADLILVGDSLGMVLYGFDSTLPVTLEMMIAHGAAVVRSTHTALIVVDMPFGSYQQSPETAFAAAARVMKETGCAAVKLEGGAEMAQTVSYMVQRGIPVMGHIGLQPQSVHSAGGYRVAGKDDASVRKLNDDVLAIADAGAFSIVIEGTVSDVAESLTRAVAVPTIGIGASAACDGQILVSEDMLGLANGHKAKFVKPFAELAPQARAGMAQYAAEVRSRAFPSADHIYLSQKRQAGSPAPAAAADQIKS